jgi:5S rRNA maturation endonuclease (ribonuclease M5)
MTEKSKQEYYARLSELSNKACDVIEDVFEALGIQFYKGTNYICGPCPVHRGDNQQAWVFYPEGHTVRGVWHCYTRGCHEKGRYLNHLIQGILASNSNEEITPQMATHWLLRFFGLDHIRDVVLPDKFVLDKRRQHTRDHYFNRSQTSYDSKDLITRRQARERIAIPSQYYLGRRYTEEILNRYDVGDYTNRVIVPVYDPQYKFVIGSTSRSIFLQCPKCKLWHHQNTRCPDGSRFGDLVHASKWFNNKFDKANSLYNLWHPETRQALKKNGKAILVEGPGDVWRIEEANIHISLGMYGIELSDTQIMLLYENYVNEIVLLADPDRAGEHALKILIEKIRKEFNYLKGILPNKDPGDLTIPEVHDIQLVDFKGRPVTTLKEYCQ